MKLIREEDKRFWAKVEKTDTCWLWTGCKSHDGYGFLHRWINGGPKGFKAHKYVWLLTRGEVGAKYVLHKCHVRHCVNPDHLYLGNQADNMRDMYLRFNGKLNRRPLKGEANHHAKLKATDVAEIRMRIARGEKQRAIAAAFKVSPATICLIGKRKVWNDTERY